VLAVAVIDGVWLQAVPYADAGSLVVVSKVHRDLGRLLPSEADISAWRSSSALQHVGVFQSRSAAVALGHRPARELVVAEVEPELFELLGESPAEGRLFAPADAGTSPTPVLVTERMAAATSAQVGDELVIDGRPAVVVGRMPARFSEIVRAAVAVPLQSIRHTGSLQVIGRLAPRVSPKIAVSELTAIARHGPILASDDGLVRTSVIPLRVVLTGEYVGPLLFTVAATVALLYAAAVANAAILLLLAGEARRQQLAIQCALGATNRQLGAQVVLETALLFLLSGALGLLLARAEIAILVRSLPVVLPRATHVALGGRGLGFTLLVTALSAIPVVMLARQTLSRTNSVQSLRRRGAGSAAHRRSPLRLVGLQVGIAVLMAALGLSAIGQLSRLLAQNIGFDPSNVVTFRAGLRLGGVSDRVVSDPSLSRSILKALGGIQGVEASGAIDMVPFGGARAWYSFHPDAHSEPEGTPRIDLRRVTPGYFTAMGIPIRSGRAFGEGDDRSAPAVAVVNESAASHFWRGRDVIGQEIQVSSTSGIVTIVGVVGDVRHTGFDGPPVPELYIPWAQEDASNLIYVVKYRGPAEQLMRTAGAALSHEDPRIAISSVASMDSLLRRSSNRERLRAHIVERLAFGALLIALGGVSMVAWHYSVRRRVDIAIRSALGASPCRLAATLFRALAPPISVGLMAGTFAAWTAGHTINGWLGNVLPPIRSADLVIVAVAIGTLASIAAQIPCMLIARANDSSPFRSE
jgi:predicted permease